MVPQNNFYSAHEVIQMNKNVQMFQTIDSQVTY